MLRNVLLVGQTIVGLPQLLAACLPDPVKPILSVRQPGKAGADKSVSGSGLCEFSEVSLKNS